MIYSKKTKKSIYTLNQLMSVNLHIGDKSFKLNSLIKNLLFGARHGIYYFNLKKTFPFLNRFLYFFKNSMERYKLLLFIGQHEFVEVILEFLTANTKYFTSTEKWVGGTLTNWKFIRYYIHKLFTMSDDQIRIANSLRTDQKIQQKINRFAEMRSILYGFKNMPSLPNLIIFFNQKDSDQTSYFEACILTIPTISIINTKQNAYGIDYPIFSNNNNFESLFFISNLMVNCIMNSYYSKRLYFLKKTYNLFVNLKLKHEIFKRKKTPLLYSKTESFFLKLKTLQKYKIKRLLRKSIFNLKYKNVIIN